jgi:hypothetical protein
MIIRYRTWLLPGICALVVFGLALIGPVSHTGSDPHFSLVASQAILEHRSFQLDPYLAALGLQPKQFAYELATYNHHTYYAYPWGTPVASLPFVAIARLLGQDMTVVTQNYQLQNLLSALLCAAMLIVLYRVGRCYLAPGPSLIIASISVLGSPLISTVGTALWSVDFSVFFVGIGVLLLARYETGHDRDLNVLLLGSMLFAAYLCRPTAAIFGLLATGFVFLASPRKGLALTGILAAWALVFLSANLWQYQRLMPPYYVAGNWLHANYLLWALYGTLGSPSRGLFIYCPFYLLILVDCLILWPSLHNSKMVWLCLAWTGAHLFMVASTDNWWGGNSFGPRLLADALPGLVVLSFIVWRALSARARGRLPIASAALYLVLGGVAIYINTYSGLFNLSAVQWNVTPNIDRHPAYLFDWQYPQFLATPESIEQKYRGYALKQIASGQLVAPYVFGAEFQPGENAAGSSNSIFTGWWPAGVAERWSEARQASILFRLGNVAPDQRFLLSITAAALQPQPVEVYLNGQPLGAVSFGGPSETHVLGLSGELLRPQDANAIELRFPQAAFPSLPDVRRLGLRYLPHRLGLRIEAASLAEDQSVQAPGAVSRQNP